MKKKYTFTISFALFLVLFFASPYILDIWQWKSALNAVGSPAVYEGYTAAQVQQCKVSCYPLENCCTGNTPFCFTSSQAPACVDFGIVVSASAGGQVCPTGYLIDPVQNSIVNGSSNVIIGGTACDSLDFVASEKGCFGCTAAINSPKVYAYKNKMKDVINFIIAGKKFFK